MVISEYWGGEPYPAGQWGRAPIRGKAMKIIHEILWDCPVDVELAATRIVDGLTEAGFLPDELTGEV